MSEDMYQNYDSTTSQTGYNTNRFTGEAAASILNIRLDCENLLTMIELNLKGKIPETIMTPSGYPMTVEKDDTKAVPLMNDRGVRGIMRILRSFLNSQIVQGNITRSEHEEKSIEIALEINNYIFFNSVDFDLTFEGQHYIMLTIPEQISLFLTRLIDNKERDSYGQMKVVETVTQEQKSGGILGLGKKN